MIGHAWPVSVSLFQLPAGPSETAFICEPENMTKLAIPISRETLIALDKDRTRISGLTNPELAGLFVLFKLANSSKPFNGPASERLLADGLRLIGESKEAKSEIEDLLQERIESFLDLTPGNSDGFFLMSVSDVANKSYLERADSWRFGCSSEFNQVFIKRGILGEERNVSLSVEHDRLIRAIEAEPEEPMAVQGFAGVGKTYLITTLAASLSAKGLSVVALAHTRQQLSALMDRTQAARGLTLGELINELVYPGEETPRPVRGSRYRMSQKFNRTYEQMAQILGIRPLQRARASEMAKIAWKTVTSFCHSASDEITVDHLPSTMRYNWSASEKAILVETARTMWSVIIDPPSQESELPMRIYHQIKLADVQGKVLPPSIRIALVDEAHDLPEPIISILDRTPPPQATFTFGDRYQHLFGAGGTDRPRRSRGRELGVSVRAGESTTDLFNRVLAAHPVTPEMEFVGIRPENTEVLSYQSLPTPNGNCAIIFRSYWALFEQFQRCAHDRSAFRLMPGSEKALQWFMSDVIELFNHGIRPSFPSLFQYGSFDDLVNREAEFADITRVVDLLTRGYKLQNLNESLSRQTRDSLNLLWLGMPEHTKNMEFDKVVVADDFFSQTNMIRKEALVSSIYTSISRVKSELYLPAEFDNWVRSLSG